MSIPAISPNLNAPLKGLGQPSGAARSSDDVALRRTAVAFEAAFLAEMLSHAGLGESRASFGGGAGEDAFASLLTQEHAKALADKGGIGLAEHIFEALKARASGDV